MKKQTKAIAKRESKQINKTDFLQVAIEKKVDIPTLEALIRLRAQEEERQAKREFEIHFAEMQKEYPAVKKSKSAKDGAKILYKYCPLENILVVYGPILSAHGFSWSWNEAPVPGKENEKTIFCYLSGWGYTKMASMDIPIMAATSFANAIQQRAISTSYGKRYTFNSVAGVIIAGEDEDGKQLEEPKEKVVPELQNIRDAVKVLGKRLIESKLFSTAELKAKSKESSDHKNDIDILKQYLVDWETELDKRKKGGK